MTQPANGYPIPPQHIPPPAQSPAQPPAAEAQPLFPAAADEDVPWARQNTSHKPLTGRSRRHLRDLPAWDPLPPGEILVQRRHRAD